MRRIAGALALLVGMVAGMPAASGSRGAGVDVERLPGAVRITLDPADRVEWTPERMARAEPIDFRPSADTASRGEKSSARPTLRSLKRAPTPVVIPGSGPAAPTELERFLAAGGMIPYDRFEVEDPSSFDVAMHGKLYMLIDDNPYSEGVCSATVVPSATGMVGFTAGHCLVSPENGLWILDGAFVPGYLGNDQNPYGFWALSQLYVTEEWYDSAQVEGPDPDARYDIAAFTVMQYPYAAGTLADTVGYRGIAFNLDQGWDYQSFGYPAEEPFDGEKMISCVSDAATIDPAYDAPPFPNGMGCDMTGGSSGGGWVIGDEEGNLYQNSVVSYSKGAAYPEMQFGPYFGQVGLDLFEEAAGLDYPDVPEPSVEQFGTGITLKFRKHLKASGRVSSSQGGCAAGAPVVVAKLKGDKAIVVAETLSNADGSYRLKVKDKPGTYIAAALERYADSFTLCGYSQTSKLKHKH